MKYPSLEYDAAVKAHMEARKEGIRERTDELISKLKGEPKRRGRPKGSRNKPKS